MPAAVKLLHNETERMAAVRRYDILDSPPMALLIVSRRWQHAGSVFR